MSRNLCNTVCYFCGHEVELVEEPREITKGDAGVYYAEYKGMLVADARCPICLAEYLAWVDDSKCTGHTRSTGEYGSFFDLSFRSSFDDEPDDDDLPQYDVQVIYHRVSRINQRIGGKVRNG